MGGRVLSLLGMDNPDPLSSILANDVSDDSDEDDDVWDMHSNTISRSEVFGTPGPDPLESHAPFRPCSDPRPLLPL